MLQQQAASAAHSSVMPWRLREFVIVGDLVAKWLKSFHVNSTKRF